MTRSRGTIARIMPVEVTGPFEDYALLVREDGAVMMVHSEGVGYSVTDEKPWTWNDFNPECPVFTPAELITLAFTAPPVDLSDWVRTFGARLESNFAGIQQWACRG